MGFNKENVLIQAVRFQTGKEQRPSQEDNLKSMVPTNEHLLTEANPTSGRKLIDADTKTNTNEDQLELDQISDLEIKGDPETQ